MRQMLEQPSETYKILTDYLYFAENVLLYQIDEINKRMEYDGGNARFIVRVAPRGSGKTWDRTIGKTIWRALTRRNFDQMIIYYTAEYATKIMKKIQETLETNPILQDMIAGSEVVRADEVILCKSDINPRGNKIYVFGWTGSFQGFHVDHIQVDDPHEESEKIKRDDVIEIFDNKLMNCGRGKWTIEIVGTRLWNNDLLAHVKDNKLFDYREYPAIIEEPWQEYSGRRAISPSRINIETLELQKQLIGERAYRKNYFHEVWQNEGALFKMDWLEKAHDRNRTLVKAARQGMHYLIGGDFATSESKWASFTVFYVFEIDPQIPNKLFAAYYYRAHGKQFEDYKRELKRLYELYGPKCTVNLEKNSIMAITKDLKSLGIPVSVSTTANIDNDATEKSDARISKLLGLRRMSVSFENGQFVIPYGDNESRELMDRMDLELNSYAEVEGKLTETEGIHPDIPMAMLMGYEISLLRPRKTVISVINLFKEAK